MNDVYQILIENLMNERLDKIAFADEEFCTLDGELDKALAHYDTLSISQQDSKTISRIFDLYAAHSARYSAISYQMGFTDAIELLRALKLLL